MLRVAKSYFVQNPEITEIPYRSVTKEFLSEYAAERLSNKTRLFFDLDFKQTTESDDDFELHRKIIKDNILGYSSYRHPIVMTEAIQSNKISFHVIFTDPRDMIVKPEFHPDDEQELFSKVVGENYFKYIDDQVYANKWWFRLPYNTCINRYDEAKSKPYPHIPFCRYGEKLPELYNYVLSMPDEEETIDYTLCVPRINRLWNKLQNEHVEEVDVDDDTKQKVIQALSLIKVDRFKEMKTWFCLGMLIKKYVGDIDLFCKLSKDSGYDNYNEKTCKKLMETIQPATHMGMLLKWMKEDGIDRKSIFIVHSPIMKELINILYENKGGLTDYNIGNALKKVYHNMFYCDSFQWVHWNEVKSLWTYGDESTIFYPIMKLLTEDLFTYINEKSKKNNDKILENKTRPKDDQLPTMSTLTLSIWYKDASSLQSVKRMKGILAYCKGIFMDNERVKIFDTKPELFSFTDGKTYNLITKEVRKMIKEDYILTTCGYDFPDRKEEDIKLIKDLLATIFNEHQLDFSIQCLSTFLYGNNINEIFLVLKGVGRNGKGLTDTLLKLVLGEFHQTISSEELTEDSKGKGRATSEMANARFARCLMTSEPDGDRKLKTDRIKLLTGRDPITARQLFGKAFVYKSQFTLGIQCNELPKFSKLDDAIAKRMVYVDFPYQFVEENEKIRDYQRVIDKTLKDKILDDVRYRNGALFLLFDNWFNCKGRIIKTIEATDNAQEEFNRNNPLSEFLEKYTPSDTFIRIKELQEKYSEDFERITPQQFKKYILLTSIKIEEDKSHGTKVFLKRI